MGGARDKVLEIATANDVILLLSSTCILRTKQLRHL